MGALKLGFLAVLLANMAQPAAAAPVERWSAHIAEASRLFGIPEAWIRRVIEAESGGRTSLGGRPIVSRAGAMGLMQLMPGTWLEMRAAHGLGRDPHDPRDNIIAGSAYLRAMYDRFGYPAMFAAYNAGPARYARHLATGRRLPAETVAYLAKVADTAPAAPAAHSPGLPSDIFVSLRGGAITLEATPPTDSSATTPLFVKLRPADRPSLQSPEHRHCD